MSSMYLLDLYSVLKYLLEICHKLFAPGNLYLANPISIDKLMNPYNICVKWLFLIFILLIPHLGAPAASAPSVATATPSEGAVNRDGQDAARTQGGNPSNNSAATRGLPARTVVAAIPARSSVEVPNHVLSLLVPAQVRSQVAMPNQSASPQGSQNTMGNGSGQHSTSAVPQASVGGVAGIPSTVAQVNQHVANALVASTPVQVPPSAQNTAEHGSHLTIDSRASDLNSSTATTTQLKSEPSISNDDRASLDVQTHATETGISLSHYREFFFPTTLLMFTIPVVRYS
jgi:hypothetical protein